LVSQVESKAEKDGHGSMVGGGGVPLKGRRGVRGKIKEVSFVGGGGNHGGKKPYASLEGLAPQGGTEEGPCLKRDRGRPRDLVSVQVTVETPGRGFIFRMGREDSGGSQKGSMLVGKRRKM